MITSYIRLNLVRLYDLYVKQCMLIYRNIPEQGGGKENSHCPPPQPCRCRQKQWKSIATMLVLRDKIVAEPR